MTTLSNLITASIKSAAHERTSSPRRLGELLGIPHGKERAEIENGRAQPHAFPLAKVVVRASILSDCAVTVLEEHYTNTSTRALDVTHTIPLPADGAVTAFEIVSGERVAKGVCKKKEEARADFESARERGKTAAIIESVRDDIHTISLANVPAQSDIVVRMTIVERLRVDDGRFEYRFPTAISPKFTPGSAVGHVGDGTEPDTDRAPDASRLTPPIKLGGGTALDLELTVAAGATDLAASLALVRSSAADGTITLRPAADAACTGDIVLRAWSRAAEAVVRAYTDGERTLVVVDPPAARRPELECPREAVFVLDRSGSMGGARIYAAKRALCAALKGLTEKDTFEIIAFDTVLETFEAEPVAATRANLRRAAEWLAQVHPRGGTEALPALERACIGRVAPGRVRTVLFLTDGDVANDGEILALSRRFDPAVRLFTVGIGLAPSAGLLSRLARLGGGTTLFVNDAQDIEGEIRRFESTFVGPIACGLGVAGARRHSGRDLFAGRSATFFVDGAPNAVEVTSVDGRFTGGAAVARSPLPLGALWARDRVTELEDRLVADPSQHGLIDPEIAELGVRHQIQTRLTSFVAVDEESQVHGEPLSIVQPTDVPGDVRCESVPMRALRSPRRDMSFQVSHSVHREMADRASMRGPASPRRDTIAFTLGVSGALQDLDAAEVAQAIGFAEAELLLHDPWKRMTYNLAFLILLASLRPASAVPPELVRKAVMFLTKKSEKLQKSDSPPIPAPQASVDSERFLKLAALLAAYEARDAAGMLKLVRCEPGGRLGPF
jgi:Ca-activated chloride channel family protein